MTKEMREFLTAWLAWATSPNPKEHEYGQIFKVTTGLCAATDFWTCTDGIAYAQLLEELGEMLDDGGLDTEYPFDSPHSYEDAAEEGTQHLNPARLAWVRAKLEVSDE